ncbi:MAG: alpha/beta hydrolase [Bacteroidota bacterium]
MNHTNLQLAALLIICFSSLHSLAQINKQRFEFEFEGHVLNGVLNLPEKNPSKGLVLIVHGSGKTKAVEQEWYLDVRMQFVQSGYVVYMWDKQGCGKSEGSFDANQAVHNSAEEVIAAIHSLKQAAIPGADNIGLWGISRAGWINPLVIQQYKDIRFWISVSGVDDKENFPYLFTENLKIEGVPQDSIDLLVEEMRKGTKICHEGGDFDAYLKATPHLRRNRFWNRFNHGAITEENYNNWQAYFVTQELEVASGLMVYIQDFESILSQVDCPVLALFGEKDRNVDWAKTKSLYERTLGQHTDLTIQSFPDGNHNLFQCKTGGLYEIEDDGLGWKRCEGFLKAMEDWLLEKG